MFKEPIYSTSLVFDVAFNDSTRVFFASGALIPTIMVDLMYQGIQ